MEAIRFVESRLSVKKNIMVKKEVYGRLVSRFFLIKRKHGRKIRKQISRKREERKKHEEENIHYDCVAIVFRFHVSAPRGGGDNSGTAGNLYH